MIMREKVTLRAYARVLALLMGTALPLMASGQAVPEVDLDVVGGSFSSCVSVDVGGADLNKIGATFVNVTLTASPHIGFRISVTAHSGNLPVELLASDLAGRLVEGGRVTFNPAALTLLETGRAATQVQIDLKHQENFQDTGPWGAEVLVRARVIGTEAEVGRPIIVRLPHGSAPDLLYMTGPAYWIADKSWRTVSEISLHSKRDYYLQIFLPNISGSDVTLSVDGPQGYLFDGQNVELSVGGRPLSAGISCSRSCTIKLGIIDSQDVYLVLPLVPSPGSNGPVADADSARCWVRLDNESDGVMDWVGGPFP